MGKIYYMSLEGKIIMIIKKDKKGFTLIELIVVIAILVILAAVAVPRVFSYVELSRTSADRATLRVLNNTTTIYAISNGITDKDIFKGYNTNEERLQRIVEEQLLTKVPIPQLSNAEFIWQIENQVWSLLQGSEIIPITPLGNTFKEISSSMIDIIKQRKIDEGGYGRSWGDFRYTDIGLKPKDWESPYDHAIYKPTGKLLRIAPEKGYSIFIDYLSEKEFTSVDNWDLIFNTEDDTWYYHSVEKSNIVDIDTLEIRRTKP